MATGTQAALSSPLSPAILPTDSKLEKAVAPASQEALSSFSTTLTNDIRCGLAVPFWAVPSFDLMQTPVKKIEELAKSHFEIKGRVKAKKAPDTTSCIICFTPANGWIFEAFIKFFWSWGGLEREYYFSPVDQTKAISYVIRDFSPLFKKDEDQKKFDKDIVEDCKKEMQKIDKQALKVTLLIFQNLPLLQDTPNKVPFAFCWINNESIIKDAYLTGLNIYYCRQKETKEKELIERNEKVFQTILKCISLVEVNLLHDKNFRTKESVIGPFAVKLENMTEEIKDFSEFESLARNLIEKEDVREEVIACEKKDLPSNFTNEILWEKLQLWKSTQIYQGNLHSKASKHYLKFLNDLCSQYFDFSVKLSYETGLALKSKKMELFRKINENRGKIKTVLALSDKQEKELTNALDSSTKIDILASTLFLV